MNYDKTDKVIKEIFKSLLSWYQIGLESSIKGGSYCIFDCVHLCYHKCHKINLKCGRLYITQKSNNSFIE